MTIGTRGTVDAYILENLVLSLFSQDLEFMVFKPLFFLIMVIQYLNYFTKPTPYDNFNLPSQTAINVLMENFKTKDQIKHKL